MIDLYYGQHNNYRMSAKPESRITVLELQLEEAIQMLRLVAKGNRTILEVEEWLTQNYPEDDSNQDVVTALMTSLSKKR